MEMTQLQKQLLSYAITFAVYASIIPWPAALILMGGIAFHEYGHLWAGKKLGFQSQGFYFIPFVGGLSITAGTVRRYTQKAFIAIMGPVWGAALALATYLLYLKTGNNFIGGAALWMTFINLFNLAPLSFLDGGQILESIVYSINETFALVVMSLSTLVAVPLLWHFNPMLGMMVGFFGFQMQYKAYQDWKFRKSMGAAAYYANPLPKAMDWKQIAFTLVCYVGLAAGLYFLMNQIGSHQLNMNSMFKE
jgi:Zn-dependent protease